MVTDTESHFIPSEKEFVHGSKSDLRFYNVVHLKNHNFAVNDFDKTVTGRAWVENIIVIGFKHIFVNY